MACEHLDQIQVVEPRTDGCEKCLEAGDSWVQLRICLTCGHVGCCDSSAGRHATGHFEQTSHAIMQAHPEGNWRFCYIDKARV